MPLDPTSVFTGPSIFTPGNYISYFFAYGVTEADNIFCEIPVFCLVMFWKLIAHGLKVDEAAFGVAKSDSNKDISIGAGLR